MGSAYSASLPHLKTCIHTSSGAMFRLSYLDLVDHILLLRQVSKYPEMLEKEEQLEYYIQDYCHRMSNNQIISKRQQSKLPWQIDWIWHVHRLHPSIYYNDCIKQIPGNYLIDKKIRKLNTNDYLTKKAIKRNESTYNRISFVPSFDLMNAVLRQRDFLNKFQKHKLYSLDLRIMDIECFEQMIENYISFMKLARKDKIIVPTFDIDLIWHTHMRYPLNYLEFSRTLCGFVLDHDDSIAHQMLVAAYHDTAKRWRIKYQSDYGQNVSRDYSRQSFDSGHCAMIYRSEQKKHTTYSNSGGCGGFFVSENTGGSNDEGSCGSGCGGGCGGD